MTTDKKEDPVETTAQIPAGFQRADTDVDDFPAHDFDKEAVLAGTVMKVKTVELMRRAELTNVRMAVVTTTDGVVCLLWESANLSNFFDVLKPDMQIHVEQTGQRALSGNRTMKLFNAYYR